MMSGEFDENSEQDSDEEAETRFMTMHGKEYFLIKEAIDDGAASRRMCSRGVILRNT